MPQYLHNPEDQQGTEIFSCCAGVSWKQLGKKNPAQYSATYKCEATVTTKAQWIGAYHDQLPFQKQCLNSGLWKEA